MKVGKLAAKNFQSYKTLAFDFSNTGLSLIAGETGSGKSGLLDAVAWTLFGTTSKDSSADGIKSWFAEGEITESTIEVEVTPEQIITITRVRGPKNDLYYQDTLSTNTSEIRGKDIPDTQKIINKLLGVTAELFITSSYIHQFSKADLFFISDAKDRREILESIADLSLAIDLSEKSSECRKLCKKNIAQQQLEQSKYTGQLEEVRKTLISLQESQDAWQKDKINKLEDLQDKSLNFEKYKEQQIQELIVQLEELDEITHHDDYYANIEKQLQTQTHHIDKMKRQKKEYELEALRLEKSIHAWTKELDKLKALPEDTCPHCLGPTNNTNLVNRVDELSKLINETTPTYVETSNNARRLEKVLSEQELALGKALQKFAADRANNNRLIDKFESTKAKLLTSKETYNHYEGQYQELKKTPSPFSNQIKEISNTLAELSKKKTEVDSTVDGLKHRLTSLNWLYDKSFEIRGALLSKALKDINDNVNRYIETYFDSRLRIQLSMKDGDKVDVEIFNNGYSCPFKQLSGGERRMLALTFNLSVMIAAQNKSGTHFSTIMIDEGLNGLDDELKVKAYALLQELAKSHESVLLIDHSDRFKSQFDNVYLVQKYEDVSEVTKQ